MSHVMYIMFLMTLHRWTFFLYLPYDMGEYIYIHYQPFCCIYSLYMRYISLYFELICAYAYHEKDPGCDEEKLEYD